MTNRRRITLAAVGALTVAACSSAPVGGPAISISHLDDLAVQSTTTADAGSPIDTTGYVHVPGGVFTHSSCVHRMPSGSIVTVEPDGNDFVSDPTGTVIERVQPCAYTPITTRAASPVVARDGGVPTTNGWLSDTYQLIPSGATTWNLLYAILQVPTWNPSGGGTNYYFPGLVLGDPLVCLLHATRSAFHTA
jgi:hypothetical protein